MEQSNSFRRIGLLGVSILRRFDTVWLFFKAAGPMRNEVGILANPTLKPTSGGIRRIRCEVAFRAARGLESSRWADQDCYRSDVGIVPAGTWNS